MFVVHQATAQSSGSPTVVPAPTVVSATELESARVTLVVFSGNTNMAGLAVAPGLPSLLDAEGSAAAIDSTLDTSGFDCSSVQIFS